ncbi:hypothetical protein JOC54_000255 [Alkalihalobacillus xiaoxiensis]|uniref:Uncharacterized protein n=1 Tax=Shouchella xiaoxiensis TaxID=766895 RepID=A0ABS2SR70_9BACI|nr:hypothetical protein [Shouchella xiaoxiensis]
MILSFSRGVSMRTFWSITSVIILIVGFANNFSIWLLLFVGITGFLASLKASEYIRWFVLGANGLFLLWVAFSVLLILFFLIP